MKDAKLETSVCIQRQVQILDKLVLHGFDMSECRDILQVYNATNTTGLCQTLSDTHQ